MRWAWGILVVCLILIGLLVWAMIVQHQECVDKGGKMVGTGEYTTTIINTGNGVFVPVESETLECTK